MPYEFGDVVLVPFPFTDQSASKRRPGVIVSNSRYNIARLDVVVMPISSQLRASPGFGEIWINHWRSAGLIKPSAVKPVFATIEQGLLVRNLGKLHPDDQVALRAMMAEIIGKTS
jgi:mRNA interferase MazF